MPESSPFLLCSYLKSSQILGYLYLKNSKRSEAIEYYQKSLKFDPNDFETWIEYATLQEHYDPKVSLEAYEKALEVMTQRSPEEIKPELLNNIGVLKMKMERFEESQAAFQKAFEICLRSDEPRMENGQCKVYYDFLFDTFLMGFPRNR